MSRMGDKPDISLMDRRAEAILCGTPPAELPTRIEPQLEEPPTPTGPDDYGQIKGLTKPTQLPLVLPLTVLDWLERELPDPDPLMARWLSTTSRVLLVATSGLGKSLIGIALGMGAADGLDFLHWRGSGRPARVLYVDGEMSGRLLRLRLEEEVERRGSIPETFYALSHEDIPDFAPLNTPAGQQCIEQIIDRIGGVDLILFDNTMSLTSGDLKDGESWQQTLPWVRSLTRRAIGQIWIHHTGHDETRSYGTKIREWQMDTVIHLEAVVRPDTDVSFSLQFRKARERTPATRADFQEVRIALVNDRWEHDAVKTERVRKVSPLGTKFYDALLNVLAGANVASLNGRKVASKADWKNECVARGLIDPGANSKSADTLFNKYKRELIGANRVTCEGELAWSL